MWWWVVGGWNNPLQTLSQGLVLTFRFTFDPELDNISDLLIKIINTIFISVQCGGSVGHCVHVPPLGIHTSEDNIF